MDNRTVSAVRCLGYSEKEIKDAFDRLLEPIGGLDFVKPGMKIAVKVNLVSAMRPEKAATTHPAVVRELCRRIAERGATAVIGDSPGGPFTKTHVKAVLSATGMTGLSDVAVINEDLSVGYCDNFEGAKVLKGFEFTSWLKDADAVINVCKLKTHGMMSMSAAVKNMFGAVPGTVKPEYHYRYPDPADFADMLVDLNEFIRPVLSIADAITGMEGNGPTMGTPRDIGILAASRSQYDLDTFLLSILGLEPSAVPTVEAAIKRGLGKSPESIKVVGDGADTVIEDFENIRTAKDIESFGGLVGISGKLFKKITFAALASKPDPKNSECIGCEKCANICPAHAITMKKGKPIIDRKACIRCFCCQEFCPKGAMKVKRPLPAKILAKRSTKR